MELMVDGEHDP